MQQSGRGGFTTESSIGNVLFGASIKKFKEWATQAELDLFNRKGLLCRFLYGLKEIFSVEVNPKIRPVCEKGIDKTRKKENTNERFTEG